MRLVAYLSDMSVMGCRQRLKSRSFGGYHEHNDSSRVFVVDDAARMRQALHRSLGALGFEFRRTPMVATSSRTAGYWSVCLSLDLCVPALARLVEPSDASLETAIEPQRRCEASMSERW